MPLEFHQRAYCSENEYYWVMRIVVAGGAGFLGSHLVDKLLDQGNHVVVLDNLFTGSATNFDRHIKNPLFKFILHDVTNPIHIEADQIFNFACPASPVHYQKNPVETIRTSIMGSTKKITQEYFKLQLQKYTVILK
jgi:UDP-glucuronate decarboxylase